MVDQKRKRVDWHEVRHNRGTDCDRPCVYCHRPAKDKPSRLNVWFKGKIIAAAHQKCVTES